MTKAPRLRDITTQRRQSGYCPIVACMAAPWCTAPGLPKHRWEPRVSSSRAHAVVQPARRALQLSAGAPPLYCVLPICALGVGHSYCGCPPCCTGARGSSGSSGTVLRSRYNGRVAGLSAEPVAPAAVLCSPAVPAASPLSVLGAGLGYCCAVCVPRLGTQFGRTDCTARAGSQPGSPAQRGARQSAYPQPAGRPAAASRIG